jgi:hypothetical protein
VLYTSDFSDKYLYSNNKIQYKVALKVGKNIIRTSNIANVTLSNFTISDEYIKIQNISCPSYVKYNNIYLNELKFIKDVPSGSDIQYSNSKHSNHIVIMRTNTNKADVQILNKLHTNCKQYVINSIPVIASNGVSYIIMSFGDGTLHDLEDNINTDIDLSIEIIKQITNAIICLKNIGLYYTDIKQGNILFSCSNIGKISVILGDLGSAVDVNNIVADLNKSKQTIQPSQNLTISNDTPITNQTVTYIPPNYKNEPDDAISTEKYIVWCLGYLLLKLHNKKVRISSRQSPEIQQQTLEENSKLFLKEVELKNKSYYDIIKKIITSSINFESKDRIDLSTLSSLLNQITISTDLSKVVNQPFSSQPVSQPEAIQDVQQESKPQSTPPTKLPPPIPSQLTK